jgi:GNAT superfamily N-acetyltransferase
MVGELQLRSYRSQDAAPVADLLNVVSSEWGGSLELPAGAVDDVIRAEVVDPVHDTRLVTEDAGRLVAVGLVRVPPDGGIRVTLEGGVHPEHRGMGIGRELLAWQVDRAAERRSEMAPHEGGAT